MAVQATSQDLLAIIGELEVTRRVQEKQIIGLTETVKLLEAEKKEVKKDAK